MSAGTLFAAQVLLYAAFPFAFAFLSRPVRLMLFYVYIAIVLVVGGFLGSVYALPVGDAVTLSAGSVLYGALILSSLMLVIGGRDARVIRNVVKIVIAVNLFKIGMFTLTAVALRSGLVANPFDTGAEVFTVSIPVVVLGGVLIIGELVLLIAVFERVKTRVNSVPLLALLYVGFFIAVLCLDGVLFPLLATPTAPDLAGTILDGVRAKLVLALAYSVPLLLFLAVFGRTLAEYREVPLRLQEMFFAPRDDLVREVERQHEALQAGEQRYRQLIESTADAVVGTTPDGEVTSWNPAAEQLFGHSVVAALGRPLAALLPTLGAPDVASLLGSAATGKEITDLDAVVRRPDGTSVHVSLTLSPVRDGGRVVGVSVLGRDTTERHRMQEALEHQALHDALTGLPNRAMLVDRLEHALAAAARDGGHVAVVFLDLDQFKLVNDASGHHTGDRLLVLVAERLRAAMRPGDTVARFGGDEFVVLCPGSDASTAMEAAERVLTVLEEPLVSEGQRMYATASVGVAVSPPDDASTLLRHADAAMYTAKSRGRGRVQLFDSSMATRAEGRLALANDLREALADGSLQLHYQPVVDLRTGCMTSLEALARWPHRQGGWVPPADFVPLAEETGMVGALSRWALTQAGADGAAALRDGVLPPTGRIAVNLSAHDVGEPAVQQMVRSAVESAGEGLSCANLVLEVTETVLMADLDRASRALQPLRDLGAAIAIDDFGTGYSSLAYLRSFPADVLKIDRSFINGITDSDQDLAIVTSVVQLAAALGLTTVAEGVETREQCELLEAMGCDAAQGYLWSPAVPMDELRRLSAQHHEGRLPQRRR